MRSNKFIVCFVVSSFLLLFFSSFFPLLQSHTFLLSFFYSWIDANNFRIFIWCVVDFMLQKPILLRENNWILMHVTDFVKQLRGGTSYVSRQQRLHGQRRMFGSTVPQWRYMHKFGTRIQIPLPLSRRVLGRKLRVDPRGSDSQTEYGGFSGHFGLLAHHLKWASLLKII